CAKNTGGGNLYFYALDSW
nr:immunoglobulin heavy chain junction region [Macaca mulatta]